ncbi:MAG: hypothetical protein WB870_04630 [Gallionellaceae bacterium]
MDRNNGNMSPEEYHLTQIIPEQTGPIDESRRRFTKSGLVVSGVLLTLASRPSLGGGGLGGGGGWDGGGGNVCRSPSGFCSANLSHHKIHQGGGGKSCSYWASNCHSWGSTTCSSYFSNNLDCSRASNCSHDSQNNPYSLLDILCRYHVGYAANYSKNSKGSYSYSLFGSSQNCNQNGYDSTAYNKLVCPTDFSAFRSVDSNCDIDYLGQNCVAALLNCRAGYTPFLTEETVKSMFSDCKAKGYFAPTAGVKWTPSQCVTYLQSTQNCTSWT